MTVGRPPPELTDPELASITDCDHLPTMRTFVTPAPSPRFYTLLAVYHLFPLHMPVTTYLMDAPFGRFSSGKNRFNVNGNVAWFVMESVAPITFITTLRNTSHRPLPLPCVILSTLYVVHYIHRAFISPLILSPKRSESHLAVPIAAIAFNLLNAYLIANHIMFFGPKITSFTFWTGVVGWAVGFAGNVYHDEILNDLRRPGTKAKGKGRYKIPEGGLFRYVSFPNYLCEWFEWSMYAMAACPMTMLPIRHFSGWLLAAPWAFVLAEVTSMLPRAWRGHKWYHDKFGVDYPKERKVVIPGVL